MSPLQLLDHYVSNHEFGIRSNTISCHYRPAVVLFTRATGCADVTAVNRETVNCFIDWLRVQNLSPETKRSRRRGMLTLLQYAFDEGILNEPLYRIKKIAVPKKSPVAWSMAQVQHLVSTIESMARPDICRVPAGLWWSSLVRAAWDTGLRLGDLLSLERDWIQSDGILRIVQSKTQREHIVRLNQSTIQKIRMVQQLSGSRLIWPMDFPRRKFFSEFKAIVKEAGLTGTFRFIRRGAITQAELLEPGAGQRLAAHRDTRTTRTHYLDPQLLPKTAVSLPSLTHGKVGQ